MYLYVTSKNTGPSYQSDPIYLLYIGTSIEEAEKAVGDFERYEKDEDHFPNMPKAYSVLPRDMEREMIAFFMADGWWYSIERFEVTDG